MLAQQIYAAVIRAIVVSYSLGETQMFSFKPDQIEKLARSFLQKEVGTEEEAYVSLFRASK